MVMRVSAILILMDLLLICATFSDRADDGAEAGDRAFSFLVTSSHPGGRL